jgi:hypothetical protein
MMSSRCSLHLLLHGMCTGVHAGHIFALRRPHHQVTEHMNSACCSNCRVSRCCAAVDYTSSVCSQHVVSMNALELHHTSLGTPSHSATWPHTSQTAHTRSGTCHASSLLPPRRRYSYGADLLLSGSLLLNTGVVLQQSNWPEGAHCYADCYMVELLCAWAVLGLVGFVVQGHLSGKCSVCTLCR